MTSRPTMVATQNRCIDSPIWGRTYSPAGFPVSDQSDARSSGSASTSDGCIRLRGGHSMPCGLPWYEFKQEPPPHNTPHHPSPDAVTPPYVFQEGAPRVWRDAGAPLSQGGGVRCAYDSYMSSRSSVVSLVTPKDVRRACRTHIIKQISLPQRPPIFPHSYNFNGGSCALETTGVDSGTVPPVRRIEPPVLFSSFFDRMQLDHIVAAKEKILKRVKNRNAEGALSFDPSSDSSVSEGCRAPVNPALQLMGAVDLRSLYNRYQKSEGCRASTSDRETSASQGTAEPSPSASDSEVETFVPQEKVFRTEAAAKLAASPAASKMSSHAAATVGMRVMTVWPKQADQQRPGCREIEPNSPAQPRQSRSSSRRVCRITYRRRDDATSPPPDLPRHALSKVAAEGSYTHMIPVSGNGNMKGLISCTPFAWAAKTRQPDHASARVVESMGYRYFVFNLPEEEMINSVDFALTSCISQGSFGTVYKALWKGEVVAIKQAHGKMTLEAMRSVAREINSYRMIQHPYIVRYFGVCIDQNFVGLVTEYLDGGNIFDILYENKANISAGIRLKMCRQLIEAVHFLHTEKRLVHRDLKTANLVVDRDYNIRLCDFGKTRSLEQHGKLKLEDNGGSPRYMAPECFVEGNYVDEKLDIWGLACCLIEILGGPIPYEDIHSNEGVIHALLYNRRKPTVPAWFHPSVRATLDNCFTWNPWERPDTQHLKNVFDKLTPSELNKYGMNLKRSFF
ncbi:Tyrosine kinase-like (TKL) protein, putative [Eimeria tenella]|uniref:Tyrosine kinase-like (TKL) protein, putative n=1 Tax=Eimeria tenella TaxID=5802 RepID=U6KPK0_EIMTE|nr:Tyrosine kinase-like (TKL) protein, putative [Eimeria tenella]CDJ38227.1 Tyrosine kinase-like (TKL) protein, putative [Eimeria tenella]|eukprot:XP_013229065.1 Tyrosine kinase-like (TKL) protein, putative [Eimeria tenella]